MRETRWLWFVFILLFFNAFSLTAFASPGDYDNDLIPDSFELFSPCLQPDINDAALDYDGDGLDSLEEYQYSPSLDPCLADTDGDGVDDDAEIAVGSNPADPLITPGLGASWPGMIPFTSLMGAPFLVATSSEYGMSWIDWDRGVVFDRLSAEGVKQNHEVVLGPGQNYAQPRVVWTGSEFGVAWKTGNNAVFFARLSSAGDQIGAKVRLTSTGYIYSSPAPIVWTGSEFGVFWDVNRDGGMKNFFARVSADGAMLGTETRIGSSWSPAPVWTGSEYGLSFTDARTGDAKIYFTRLSPAGDHLIGDVRISNGYGAYPEMKWTGSEFGLAWLGSNSVLFSRVSPVGEKIGGDQLLIGSASYYNYWGLAWTGSEYGLGWRNSWTWPGGIQFSLISSTGQQQGRPYLTARGTNLDLPSLASNGSDFLQTWIDYDLPNQAFFSRICLDDWDGDDACDFEEFDAGSDPNDWDTDDDGMSDGWEIDFTCMSPTEYENAALPDRDGDGISDGAEYAARSNPCELDTDGDGLTDYEEIMIYFTDPSIDGDADHDGVSDADEVLFSGTNPQASDTDGDNLSDYDEIYLYGTDPNARDTDGDLVSDYDEITFLFTDPLDIDSDSDGVFDNLESGLDINDRNGNGLPDNWESGHIISSIGTNQKSYQAWSCLGWEYSSSSGDDPDGDGLSNLEEFQYWTDPCSWDTDGDGIEDGQEVHNNLTDPTLADTDGDGLDDNDELGRGTSALISDTDGDGFSDGAEVQAGTDPKLASSHPVVANGLVSYQGRLADANGAPVNGTRSLTFRVFEATTGGTARWSETQTTVPVVNGLYSVLLGSVNPLTPEVFGGPERWLEVAVNGETLAPRTRITSAPYAMQAERAFGVRQEMDTRELALNYSTVEIVLLVSFKQPFSAPPQVLVSPPSGLLAGKRFVAVEVSEVTTTGFKVVFQSLSGEPATFNPYGERESQSFTYFAFGK